MFIDGVESGFQPHKGAIRPDLVPILSYHPAGRSRNEQRTGQEDRRSKFYETPDNLRREDVNPRFVAPLASFA